ncbi:putative DNA primase/helicase [Phyllobacterium sp. YR620]|uniref:toprim domain-containing protein n=1 Tax=Phyllobacterium sp. YR620 TaxID=1881066 RepID=UPI00088119E3|nr:toprim domain-containing protein [Phyllobacterium sp. YR620]SDP55339.1 putative DNA primase/helicase [Phyllobacterium sp. YR620]
MDSFPSDKSQGRGLKSPDDIVNSFLDAMRAAGVNMDTGSNKGGHPIADGKVHRADAIGQRNKRHIWYVLHADHPASGAFGDLKLGVQDTWTVTKVLKQLSKEERKVIADRIERNKREREAEQKALNAEAAEVSARLYTAAKKPVPDHPYIAKKGLPIFPGLKQLFEDFKYKVDGEPKTARAGNLVVPIFKPTAEKPVLVGAQLIQPDGVKRFVKGTAKDGNYHSIGRSNGGNVFIGEGYATCARVHEATGDLCYVAFDAGNLKSVAINIRKKFPDKQLILIADNDRFTTKPVDNPGLTFATAAAEAVNAIVAVPTFPDKEVDATDFDDLYRISGIEAVRKTIADAIDPPVVDEINAPPIEELPFSDPGDGHYSFGPPVAEKPLIRVVKGKIHEAVDAAIEVLASPAVEIYARGSSLVRVIEYLPPTETLASLSRSDSDVQRSDGATIIQPVDADVLIDRLGRFANFTKWDGRTQDDVAIDCPRDVAQMIISRRGEGWGAIPHLRAVIQCPCLRPDGTVLLDHGYDKASGLLLKSSRAWLPVPEMPTKQDARNAVEKLSEPIADFPFVANSDRSAALGLLITAVIRAALPTAPMSAVRAPSAGSGKSLLVDIAAVLATGKAASVVTPTHDEAELEKRIGAAAIAGDAILNIDNLTSTLRSDQLCQMLTQPSVQVRVLGKSENLKIESTALICATGNGLSLYGDLNRRTVIINLDANCDRPDERAFDFDPVEVAKRDRAELVAAALTIVRAYIVAGRPDTPSPMGSFKVWSDLVRGALIWLGMGDPRGNTDQMRNEDPEIVALREVMDALPREPFTVKQIRLKFGEDPVLRSALSPYADRGGGFNSTKFTGFLRRFKDRWIGGRAIVLIKTDDSNGGTWAIEAIKQASN